MVAPPSRERVRNLPVALIDAGRYQPRRRFDESALAELAESVRLHGIIQPLVVRPYRGRFELIAGERRLRAAQRLGLQEVPVIVREYSDAVALETALIENLQRQDLSVVEAARAYLRLAEEFHYSQLAIAVRTGKSRSAVSNTLRLLQLPDAVLEMLDAGDLTEGHARALLALPYPSVQVEVAEWIIRNAVPVRETERKVRSLLSAEAAGPVGPPGAEQADVHVTRLEELLRQRFATKTIVDYRRGRGAITIEFYSAEDLDRLLELLGINGNLS